MVGRSESILAKIMARVVVEYLGYESPTGTSSPCLTWQGPTSGTGRGGNYGRMALDGQTVAVHLVVFTHFHGYIPGKKQIDHLCNNRLCCNHAHLEMVTHRENQKRRVARTKRKKA